MVGEAVHLYSKKTNAFPNLEQKLKWYDRVRRKNFEKIDTYKSVFV